MILCALHAVFFMGVFAVSAGEIVSFNARGWVGALAFSPDDKVLAMACSDGNARLRTLGSGQEKVLSGHSNAVVTVAYSSDGNRLVTGSFDRTLRIWNEQSGACEQVLIGHKGAVLSAIFSDDGKTIASGGLDGTIQLWDANSRSPKRGLRGHKSWVNALAIARIGDAEHLISGSSDGTIKEWGLPDGNLVRTIDATTAEVRSVAAWPARAGEGTLLIAAGIRYGTLRTWEGAREKLNFKAHQGDIWSVAVLPERHLLITGDGDWDNPGEVKIWRAESGELVQSYRHSAEVLSLAVSHHGTLMAAGARDGAVKVWNLP
jgi:WD40 repeat protein